jgi:hypothetical protein
MTSRSSGAQLLRDRWTQANYAADGYIGEFCNLHSVLVQVLEQFVKENTGIVRGRNVFFSVFCPTLKVNVALDNLLMKL